MKNIFSFIPNEWRLSLNKKSSSTKEEDSIGHLIYKYIPLKVNGLEESFGFMPFKKSLINEIKSSSNAIEQIANIALKLCDSYLKYDIQNGALAQCNNLYSPNRDLIPYPLIKEFHDELYETNSYHDELKALLILSYCYTKSLCHLKSSELAPLFAKKKSLKEQKKSLKKQTKKEYDENPRLLYDKLYLIYQSDKFDKTAPLFLSPLLEYRKEGKGIIVDSWYDSEILLGLIQSNSKRKNPFIFSKRISKLNRPIKTNLDNFLECFHHININNDRKMDTLSFVPKDLSKNHITETKIQIYNQFFLERLTNVNFINYLYEIQNTSDISTDTIAALINFVNSPLLRFRLKVLTFYKKHHNYLFMDYPLCLPDWNRYINNVLLHQLVCTLPILDLIFHYLVHLRNSLEFANEDYFDRSIDDYFTRLNTSDSLHFFKYDNNKKYKPIPCLYRIPNNIYDKDYAKLNDTIYENLIYKTNRLSKNEGFSSRLNQIRHDQEAFLVKELLSINDPITPGNSLNIVKINPD